MKFDPLKKRKHKSWTPKPIEVSIITVNYNGYNDTCQMIDSIRKHIKSVVYEIIVVDNASQKDEASLLRAKYPFIRTIRSRENSGFAGGNNLGSYIAKGRYLFFLNNDTFIKEDQLRCLIETLETRENAGGVCPLIRYADEDELIQFAGFTPLSRFTLRNRSIGIGEYLSEKYLQPAEIPYMHGAAMLIKREVYQRAGRMPCMYFLYYEELDWSLSIRNAGYRLFYDPRFTVYHKESRSTGTHSPLRVFYLTRNRFLFAYRNRRFMDRIICYLYLLLLVLPKDCLLYFLRFQFKLVSASIRGTIAYFKLNQTEKLNQYGFKYAYTRF